MSNIFSDKRKLFGTILGLIMFSLTIVSLTYAYYSWRSSNTVVTFNIQDNVFFCETNINSSVSNLSPVNDYKQGTHQSFVVKNIGRQDTTFSLTMNVTNISSDVIKDESFKYRLMLDPTGGSNNCSVDDTNCTLVGQGNFANIKVGMNTLVQSITLPNNSRYQYYFFMYLDGTMSNPTGIQNQSMTSTLGVCDIYTNLDKGICDSVSPNCLKLTADSTYGTAVSCSNPNGSNVGLPNATTADKVVSFNSNASGVSNPADRTVSYTFDGWYRNNGFTGNIVTNSTPVTTTENETLYAKCSPNSPGGSITLPTITRDGYTFSGWYDAATNGNKVGDAGGTYTPSSSITLFAHWISNNYYNVDTNTYYEKLSVALDQVASNQTIQVMKSVSETTKPVLATGKTGVKLDMNGKTTTLSGSSIYLENNGALDIYSSVDGGILQGNATRVVYNNGTLTTNGTSSSHTLTIQNTSSSGNRVIFNNTSKSLTLNTNTTVTCSTAVTESAVRYLIHDLGVVNINGATLINHVSSTVSRDAGIYIGDSAGRVVMTSGSIDVGGNGINNYYGTGTGENAAVAISGGSITSTSTASSIYGIYNDTSGSINVSGGSVSGYYGIYNYSTGIINVSGASTTVTGTSSYGIYGKSGTVIISNGTITGATDGIYMTTGSATVTGGTVIGGSNGIQINSSSGSLTLGTNDGGTPSITVPEIKSNATSGTYYGVYMYSSSSTFNFYDGKVVGYTTHSTNRADSAINKPSGYSVVKNTASSKETATLQLVPNYLNVDTNTYYITLKEALDDVASNQTIRVLESLTETTKVTLADGKTGVKLDMNGKTTTFSGSSVYLENNGELDIYSSVDGAILKGSANRIIYNNGTLTTNGTSSSHTLTIQNTTSSYSSYYVIYNYTGKEMTLNTNTTVTYTASASGDRYLIYDAGILNISGAELRNYISGTKSRDRGVYISNSAGRVIMTSGTIYTGGYGIYNSSGSGISENATVVMSGGTITSTDSDGIYNYDTGEVHIVSGTVTGKQNGINLHYSGCSLTLGTNDGGTPSTTVPEITSNATSGTYYGVYDYSSCTFNFYDGKVVGYSTHSTNKDISTINTPTGYVVEKTTANSKETASLTRGYEISYNLRNGTSGTYAPTSGGGGNYVRISNPTKMITVTALENGTGATISGTTSGSQTFAGWTSSSSDGLNSDAKRGTSTNPTTAWDGSLTTNQYFMNLGTVGNTVVMTANWTVGAFTLPTVTKDNYVCTLNTESNGSGTSYESGGSYTPSDANGSVSVNMYAFCTETHNYLIVDTGVYYATLWEAFSAVNSNQTIQVRESLTEITQPVLADTKTGVKLDMNGKTTTLSGVYLQNNGELDIYSSVDGGILQGDQNRVIYNNGTLTTNGTSSSHTLTIRSTATSYSSYYVIYNNTSKTATLNTNTTVTYTNAASGNRYLIYDAGTLNIDGATLTNHVNTGTNISRDKGIYIGNSAGRAIMTSGTIDVGSGGIYNNSGTGTGDSAAVVMSGGSITCTTSNTTFGIFNGTSGEVNVSGGSISSFIGISNSSGITNISGSTTNIIGTIDYGVTTTNGTVNVSGGTITGARNGIHVSGAGTVTLGENSGTPSTTVPEIKSNATSGDYYGVYMQDSAGTFNFYDGKIVGYTNHSTNRDDSTINRPSDYIVVKNTENSKEIATLVHGYNINYNLNNGISGTNAPIRGVADSVVVISNPTKSITVTVLNNGTDANISGTTTGPQVFGGWTSNSSDGLSSNAKRGTTSNPTTTWNGSATTNTYFKNIGVLGGTITLTANWTPTAFNLPTVTKTGVTCTINTKSDGSGTSYASGGSYTPSDSSAGTSVVMYAICDSDYTIDYDLNDGISDDITSHFGNVDSVIEIGNPTRTITITALENGTGATISSGTVSKNQTFGGWSSSVSAGLSSSAMTGSNIDSMVSWDGSATTNTYFKNLAGVNGTVRLTANWIPTEITLPTVTKSDNVCVWNTKADGTGTSYVSGGVYLPDVNGSNSITLYAKCLTAGTNDNYLNLSTDTFYQYLYSAFNEVESNQTIVALKNVSETTKATLAAGKTGVKLDMNGKTTTFNSSVYLENNGTLDIYSSIDGGILQGSASRIINNNGTLTTNGTSTSHTLTIRNTTTSYSSYYVIYSYTDKILTLNENTTVTYTRSASGLRYLIYDAGILNINGASLINHVNTSSSYIYRDSGIFTGSATARVIMTSGIIDVGGYGINNYYGTGTGDNASVVMSGGSIISTSTSSSYYGIYNYLAGEVNVTGGSVIGSYGIYNNNVGAINVSGSATITGRSNAGIYNSNSGGVINVSGGSVTGTYGIYNNNAGTINVSGSATTVTATSEYGIYGYTGTVTVSGGTIIGKKYGIYISSGSATVTGGTVIGNTQNGIRVESATGSLTLGENSGIPSTTVPEIISNATSGTYYGVYMYNSGGIFNFYDGKVVGYTSHSTNRTDANINTPTGYGVVKSTANNKETATLTSGYVIDYDLNNGISGENAPVSASIGSDVIISNPSKTITVTVLDNGTGATISGTASGLQTFAGWTSSSSAGLSSSAKTGTSANPSTAWNGSATTNRYFRDLASVANSVTLTANWTANSFILPTVTRNNDLCTINTSSNGNGTSYESGGSYTPSDANGSATVTLYAICTATNYKNVNTNSYYVTLNDALSAVANNQTIRVLNNVTETTKPVLANNKTGVKLDMNGKTITFSGSSVYLENNGTLDIYSSVNGGVITGSVDRIIYNNGTLTTNGTSSSHTLTIQSTAYNYNGYYVIYNKAGMTATLNSNTTVTYTASAGGDRYLIYDAGVLNINGATLNNYISSTKSRDRGVDIHNSAGRIIMTSGTIHTGGYGIYNYNGTGTGDSAVMVMSSGTITSTDSTGIYNYDAGEVHIVGGTVTGNQNGIDLHYGGATLTLGTNDGGTPSTAVPEIRSNATSGDYYGVYAYNSSCVFNFYDGKVVGYTGHSTNRGDSGINKPSGYAVVKTNADDKETAILSSGYVISYELNNGTSGANAPTEGNIGSDVVISNPSKTVTITTNVNNTGATISGTASGVQTFAGWTSSSSAGLSSSAKTGTSANPSTAWNGSATTNRYFRDLASVGNAVTMTANWTPVAFNLPTVTKNNYVCTWNTKSDGTGTSYASGGSYTPSADSSTSVPLYAICAGNTYKINLNNQSATNAGTASVWYQYNTSQVIGGTTCYYYSNASLTTCLTSGNTISVPSKDGYTFGGYYTGTNGSGTQYINSSGQIINNLYQKSPSQINSSFTDTITLYAKWTANSYTLTFNSNGATTNGTGSVQVTYGSSSLSPSSITLPQRSHTVSFNMGTTGITQPSSIPVSLTLDGWYTSSSSGSKLLTNSTSPALQANVTNYTGASGVWTRTSGATVYAHWNDGSVTLPALSKNGYTCKWAEGSADGTLYNPGTSRPVNANKTYYAVCNLVGYEITVNAGNGISVLTANGWTNSGSATITNDTYTAGSQIDLSTIITPTFKNGYSGVTYTKVSGSGTLSGSTFTVGTGVATITINATTLANPTCSISGGTTKIYNYQATELTATNSTAFDSGVTLSYQFGYAANNTTAFANFANGNVSGSPNKYSVTKALYRGTRYYGVKITATGEGSLTSTCTTEVGSGTAMVLKNKKLTFNATQNGGTLSGTGTLYIAYDNASVYTGVTNATAGTIPTASKDGYAFDGWYTAASGGVKVINANGTIVSSATDWVTSSKWTNTSVSDATLYAQYTANCYTITVKAGAGLTKLSRSGWTGTGTATLTKSLCYGATDDLSGFTPTYKNGYSGVSYTKTSGLGSISDSTFTVGDGVATITINATGITAPTPTVKIDGGTSAVTKIYGASTSSLSATVSNSYDSSISVTYTYYYDTSSSGSYTNTQNSSISETSHHGIRYYKVKAVATGEGNLSSNAMSSNNVSLTLKRTSYTPNANSCGTLGSSSAVYAYKGESALYTAATGGNTTTWTSFTVSSGYEFMGWYDASSGGNRVLDASGNLTGTAVSGYTTATAFDSTVNRTLYARCVEANYKNLNTNVYYTKLSDALADVQSNQTIQVQKSLTETTKATLADGKTGVKLDMNGKTTTFSGSSVYLENNGELDIYSSVNGAILKGSANRIIYNNGTLTTNGTSSSHTLTIQNTTTSYNSYYVIYNNTNKTVTLNTNTTVTYTASASGNRYLIYDAGILNINGATLNNYISSTKSRDRGITVNGSDARIIMTSGTIYTGGYGIYNSSGTGSGDNSVVVMSGGTITSTDSDGIYNYDAGEVRIVSGTVTGKQNGINLHYSGCSLTLGTNDANTPSTTIPEITSNATSGTYYGVYDYSSCTFNFYDGKVVGYTTHSTNKDISAINTPVGYVVEKNTANRKETATLTRGYEISYNLRNGISGTYAPTGGGGGNYVRISNPTKTITVTVLDNGSGANISGTASGSQTFAGWTSSSSDGLSSSAKRGTSTNPTTAWDGSLTTNQYFNDLGTTGNTVIMTANWTASSFNLPTVNKPNYICTINTKSNGSGTSYESGASYTPSDANGSASVTMYVGSCIATYNYYNVDTNTYYATLKAALDAVQSNQTIQVRESLTETEMPTLASGKTGVKLDMYGKTTTLSSTYLQNNGELDIYSSVAGGILQGNSTRVIYNNGTLTTNGTSSTNNLIIRNTTTSYSNYYVIYNNTGKTATFNTNTTITYTNGASGDRYLIYDAGIININGATLTNNISSTQTRNIGIRMANANSRVIMTSGTINVGGYGIYNENGTGTGDNAAIVISGGTITSTNNYGIYNYVAGTVNVSGGSVSGTNGIYNNASGAINISGSSTTVTGTSGYGIYGYTGTVTISSGTVTGASDGIYMTTGSATITGGTVIGSQNGVRINSSSGSLTLGTNDGGTPSTTVPEIRSNSTSGTYYGVYMYNSSSAFNFYDGKVIGYNTHSTNRNNDGINKPTNYSVIKNFDGTSETAYLSNSSSYTLTLNDNGATTSGTSSVGVIQNSHVVYPSAVTLPIKQITVSYNMGDTGLTQPSTSTNNLTLEGWYTAASSGSLLLSNATSPILQSVSGYTDSYGNWTKSSGGTAYAHWAASNVVLPALEKEDYICKWAEGSASGTQYSPGTTRPLSANTTYYASCEQISYTVSYASMAACPLGSGYASATVNYGDVINKANPTCTGFTFDGWTLTNGNTSTAKYGTTSNPTTAWVNKNKGTYFKNLASDSGATPTMTANWIGNTYTLTVLYNSNSNSGSLTPNYNTSASCTVTDSSRKCTVTIPSTVRNSVGKYNGGYIGLASELDTATLSVPKETTSITLSSDQTYYAVYSNPLKIYYPNNSNGVSNISTALYRNEWFDSVSTMDYVTATDQTSVIQASSVTLNNARGVLIGLATTYNTTTNYLISSSTIIQSSSSTYYAVVSGEEAYTVVYNSNTTSGSFTKDTDSTATVPSTYYCKSTSAVQVSHGTATCVPSSTVTESVGQYNSPYKGLSSSSTSIADTTSCKGGSTYYAYYSQPLTIHYPNTSNGVSNTSTALYRNEYFKTTTSMNWITATAQNTSSQSSSITLNNSVGSFEGLALELNTDTNYGINSDTIIKSDLNTYYAVVSEDESYTIVYNSNTTNGSVTVATDSTSKAPLNYYCVTATTVATSHGSRTCAPSTTVSGSVGQYNSAYSGLSSSSTTITDTTSCTGGNTYYAYYSQPLTIYYPNTSNGVSSTSTLLHRNEYFSGASQMEQVITNSSSSVTPSTTISGGGLVGTFSGFNSSMNTSTYYAINSDTIKKTNIDIFYVVTNKSISISFYYYNGSGQRSVSETGGRIYYVKTSSTVGFVDGDVTVPTTVISSHGINNSSYIGVSASTSSSTITTTITTAIAKYYSVYGDTFIAQFNKETPGISSIGSTMQSCNSSYTSNGSSYSGTNCTITMPSITPSNGYLSLGWYNETGETFVGDPGYSDYITSNKTYLAKSKRLIASEFSYDDIKTDTGCSNVQCMIDWLDDLDY